MKLTLCGSIAFIDEMLAMKIQLETLGHEVQMPPTQIADGDGQMITIKDYYARRQTATEADHWVWQRKAQAMKLHFDKVAWADAIVILNYDKNNIANYIGPNTLLEMGLAFHHNKPIYLLHPLPELPYQEELLGMHPTVLQGNLGLIGG